MKRSTVVASLLPMLCLVLAALAGFSLPAQAAAGKPSVTAQSARLANDSVELAVKVLAPGKTIQAVRIDNLSGVSARWRSDGKEEAAPLAVASGGAQALGLALGEAETPLALTLKDNGAFAGKATDFRVTVFFTDGGRAMCELPATLVTAAKPGEAATASQTAPQAAPTGKDAGAQDSAKAAPSGGGGKAATTANTAELTAYPGVKYNKAYSFIADRVAKINAREITRGKAAAAGASGNAGGAPNMFSDMIKNQINEQISKIDEQISEMKKSGMDEKSRELVISQLEDAKKQMLESLQATNTSRGSGAAGGGGLTRFRLDQLRPSEAMKGYKPDDEKATAKWALSVASDMASATIFNCVTPELMNTAGLAVSVYPHPLLLNNYAGLLRDESPMDALFFYFAALEFEPRNALILTNIGMTYLDMGQYDAAKAYALLALQCNPESGQAYQILTICHLKDGNSVLAAETLFKSTRDYFDELTVQLFHSYFKAVDELRRDSKQKYGGKFPEFPINDLVLELLYETARKYVDTADVNQSIDTPEAQLTLKPYPSFGDGENIMNSMEDYYMKFATDRAKRDQKLDGKRSELEAKIFNRNGGPETLMVINNMRQYYAYLTLEKYYEYQYRKKYYEWHYDLNKKRLAEAVVGEEFCDRLWAMWKAACARETAIINEKKSKIESLQEEIRRLEEEKREEDKAYEASRTFHKTYYPDFPRLGWFESETTPGEVKKAHEEKVRGIYEQIGNRKVQIEQHEINYMLKFYRQCQSDLGLLYGLCKQYAARYVDMDTKWYNENKQLMEEFWLKAGGVLKYMTDPNVLELCQTRRERFVVTHVNINTYGFDVGDLGGLQFAEGEAKHNKDYPYYYECVTYFWNMQKSAVELYYKSYNMYQEKIEDLEKQAKAFIANHPNLQPPQPVVFGGDPVEIEGRALQKFKDPNAEPTQGFSVGDYYFRFNSDGYEWKLPFDERGKYEYAGGRETDIYPLELKPLDRRVLLSQKAATAYDVAAKISDASDMPEIPDKIKEFAEKMKKKEIDLDEVSDPLSSVGAVKKGIGMIGDVVGFIGMARAAAGSKTGGDITYYRYVTRDERGRVVDQGDIYERQVGGSVNDFGVESKVTVTRSKMTGGGVAIKENTRTLKYKFATSTY